MRRGILGAIGGQIVALERWPCPRRPIAITPRIDRLQRRLVGQSIAAVERIGKKVVVRTDSDDRLIFEPRMTGLVLVGEPPSRLHLRFRLELARAEIPEIWYWDRRGLGSVYLVTASDFPAQCQKWNLGPDACEISVTEFVERVGRVARPIKVALLDQSLVAGVGNLYASELLHRAKVSPTAIARELSVARLRKIHRAMQEVLALAIEYEGSTLADGTYRNALNQAGTNQNEHRVYDREGATCTQCRRATIERIVQAQRATFFCPRCQPSQS